MRIAESSIEEIRQRTDIVELVREYLPSLKRAGRNHKACCPFHQERTPSFMVNPDKQIFHCFGCQAGGDVFGFLMKIEGLSFPEAAHKLGERSGVHFTQAAMELGPQEKERLRLKNALEFARDYYHEQLLKSPEAQPARSYLAKRGVNPEMIRSFRLGYASKGGSLLPAASSKGYGSDLLAKAGLAALREGSGYRDYFWARILYPITNAKGEVAGFGARALADAEPKYLNSPDTMLFSKGKILYGLYEGLARLRKQRRALVLEGYMDVIALHQFGLSNSCAPLGTALTEEHAALLKRYADDVTLIFDPDAAGAAASLRGADLLLERGLSVRIATVPDGLDPDECLHKRGVQAFQECLRAAQDLAAFRTDLALKGRNGPLAPEEKSRVAAAVLETVRKCPDEVLKSEWMRRLAERLGSDEAALHLQLRKGAQAPPSRRIVQAYVPDRKLVDHIPALEGEILLCLMRQPSLVLKDNLALESDFSHPCARAIFIGLREILMETGEEGWARRLFERLEGKDSVVARGMLIDERELTKPAHTVAALVGAIRRRRRLAELEPLVLRMGADAPVDAQLQQEYNRLLTELKGMRKGE